MELENVHPELALKLVPYLLGEGVCGVPCFVRFVRCSVLCGSKKEVCGSRKFLTRAKILPY